MSKNDSLGQAVGGKLEIELNGVPCLMRPISMGDMGDMETWVKSSRIKEFRDATEGMDEKLRMSTICQMTMEPLDDDAMNKAFASLTGARQLLSFVGERVDGKEFIVDDLVDLHNVESISSVLGSLSGFGGTGDDGSPPDPAPLKP